jgi:hypothetical protein
MRGATMAVAWAVRFAGSRTMSTGAVGRKVFHLLSGNLHPMNAVRLELGVMEEVSR